MLSAAMAALTVPHGIAGAALLLKLFVCLSVTATLWLVTTDQEVSTFLVSRMLSMLLAVSM